MNRSPLSPRQLAVAVTATLDRGPGLYGCNRPDVREAQLVVPIKKYHDLAVLAAEVEPVEFDDYGAAVIVLPEPSPAGVVAVAVAACGCYQIASAGPDGIVTTGGVGPDASLPIRAARSVLGLCEPDFMTPSM